MPIKDLSDSVRLPRIGKIHLGTRHPEKGYPMKADHFIFPPEHSAYAQLVELYGTQPKELPILIPSENDEDWCSQYYRAYNQTYGLICKGDGETAMRMVSVETGELPDATKAGTVKLQEQTCEGRDCPDYQAKKCHEVMNVRFMLPEIPGLGVWQIDTGSKNSILNINSCAKIIRRAFGRISMIPLKLTFEPIEVNQPDTGKKQTVYVLNLRTDVTLAQLADAAREQSKTFMLEAPDLEGAFDIEVEKDIQELWGKKDEPQPEAQPEVTESQIAPSSKLVSPNGQPEPETPVQTEAQEQPEEMYSKVKSASLSADVIELPCFVNLDWLKLSLVALQEKRLKAWSNANVLSYLNIVTGKKHAKISDACQSLSKEQAEKFVARVSDALSMM